MSFTELSHTADVKIQARAPTLEALFSDAFQALMQVMYGNDRKEGTRREFTLHADNHESLLVDFLSEVLFISEVDGLVFSHADITISRDELHAILYGEAFDPLRHAGGTEVKGISYSGLIISHDTNGYMLDILLDV
ncbi:archease [Methanoregula sp.]|uniref:archease n=1 Tax=Methanoregula sp. TaxID=2052170 RepID=UPI000CB44D81|nr:archease [Methanoregula sp.]PKG33005.1 MAG: protein archease [Methanoregula sp.]